MDFESILNNYLFVFKNLVKKKKNNIKNQASKNVKCNTKTKTDFY